MKDERESAPVEETTGSASPPPALLPILVPIVLSVLIGMLLVIVAVGVVFYGQQKSAWQHEAMVAREELKEKNLALDEMRAQIEALSHQIDLLKEYSIARSGVMQAKRAREQSAPLPVGVAGQSGMTSGGGRAEKIDGTAAESATERIDERTPARTEDKTEIKAKAETKGGERAPALSAEPPVLPAIPPKRVKPEGESCDLMGKSAEEQAAILKRCVGAMDSEPPKERRPSR